LLDIQSLLKRLEENITVKINLAVKLVSLLKSILSSSYHESNSTNEKLKIHATALSTKWLHIQEAQVFAKQSLDDMSACLIKSGHVLLDERTAGSQIGRNARMSTTSKVSP